MTFKDKIKLINDMIKEDASATIADYQAAVAEIEEVEAGVIAITQRDGETKREYILKLAASMTASQIRHQTKFGFTAIYKALKKGGFDLKEARNQRREELKQQQAKERAELLASRQLRGNFLAKEEKKWKRAPAEYSNHSPYGIAS